MDVSEYEHAWDDPLYPSPIDDDEILATKSTEKAWPALSLRIPDTLIGRWGEEMASLGYLYKDSKRLDPKMLSNSSAKKRDDMVTRTITDYIYEFAYNEDEPKDIYWRERVDGSTQPFSRVPVDRESKWLKNVVHTLYSMFFRIKPASEVRACMDNVYQSILKKADLDNGLWYACADLFWDSEERQLIDGEGLKKKEVYKEIGATSRTPGVSSTLIREEFDRWNGIFDQYKNEDGTEKNWEDFYKELPIEYEFVKVWAKEGSAGWVDRYWDTCIATSTNFMFNKPPVMYMLKGKTRNGKSTYVDHLHNLIGRHQTTDLTLPDLSDWSLNNALFGSLLNAPDEDPASKLDAKATAAFKTLSSKAEMKVQVKYSSIPLRVKPRFMIFDPRNDLPSFFGDPIPCLKRIKFIFFLNDLSKKDNKPHDFWKDTFVDHPDLLSRYVGFLLSLAKYFSEHKAWYSKTMEASADYVAETVVSTNLYYRIWKEFYAGYESFDLLKHDYMNFCKERGYEINDETILRSEFFQEGQNFKKRYYAGTKCKIYMYTTDDEYTSETYKSGKHILCREEYIPGFGKAKDIVLNGTMSCVDILKRLQDEALEESMMKNKQASLEEDENDR